MVAPSRKYCTMACRRPPKNLSCLRVRRGSTRHEGTSTCEISRSGWAIPGVWKATLKTLQFPYGANKEGSEQLVCLMSLHEVVRFQTGVSINKTENKNKWRRAELKISSTSSTLNLAKIIPRKCESTCYQRAPNSNTKNVQQLRKRPERVARYHSVPPINHQGLIT